LVRAQLHPNLAYYPISELSSLHAATWPWAIPCTLSLRPEPLPGELAPAIADCLKVTLTYPTGSIGPIFWDRPKYPFLELQPTFAPHCA
jgi:hypothetical protein